jgi:hypothetical protein
MLPINVPQSDQGSSTANLQKTGECTSPLLVKTPPEPAKEFWPEFIEELGTRYGIFFDELEKSFRDRE